MRNALWLCFLLFIIGCQAEPTPTPTRTPTATPTATPQIGLNFATVAPPTAAIVQVTPSPLPTNTPTPTPTPIVYTINEGDTVWSIAYTNGTVPDALLALNPNVRPELLSVGQTLILPPPATPIFGEASGTAVPIVLRVRSVNVYGTPAGGVWVMGEVENEGAFAAENMIVTIELAAPDGSGLGSADAFVAAPLLPAGERAPFGLFLPNIDDDVRVASTTISGDSALMLGNRSLDLATFDAELDAQNVVSARIQNIGTVTTTASIIATVYDSAGAVTGFSQIVLPEPLRPTATEAFTMTLVPIGSRAVDVRLFAFGLAE